MDSVAPKAMGQVCTFTLLEIGGISGGIVPDLNRPRTPSKKEIVWSVAQGARKCDCDTQDRTNASGFQSCRSARAANSIVDHTAFITYGCQLETVPASLHPPWFLLYHFCVGPSATSLHWQHQMSSPSFQHQISANGRIVSPWLVTWMCQSQVVPASCH